MRFDPSADARIEPADLPRDWRERSILYARELSAEKNAALVAAMPERTAWRIIVFQDRIGLQRWSAATEPDAASPGSAATPAAEPESAASLTPPSTPPAAVE